MGLMSWFLQPNTDALVVELAQVVAEASRDTIWSRIAHRAGALASLPEARGYVRTRALKVVRHKLRDVVQSGEPLSGTVETRIIQRALDVVVRQFAGPMVTLQPALASSRRAA